MEIIYLGRTECFVAYNTALMNNFAQFSSREGSKPFAAPVEFIIIINIMTVTIIIFYKI